MAVRTILDFEKVGYLMLQIKKKYANTGMQTKYPVSINAFTPLVFMLLVLRPTKSPINTSNYQLVFFLRWVHSGFCCDKNRESLGW